METVPYLTLCAANREVRVANITIRDVAKRAGVGVGTVSRVLNDNPSVSDNTRQKVVVAIKELNFTPHSIARRLSLRKTLAIAVIVPFFTRPSYVERLRGVEYLLADTEYDLILYNVETTARRDACFHNVPRRKRIDGLLLVSLSPRDDDASHFLESGVPTVLIDGHHPQFSRVVTDDVAGGHMATQHLIELGHQRIAFVSDYFENPFNFVSSRDRFTGYRQALKETGIPFNPEHHRQGEHSRQKARELAHELLAMPDPPTAIFASSDIQAIGVLEAARDAGLEIPKELSVVGYDDIEIAEYFSLTTIRQPLFASGVEGVELLLETIAEPFPYPHRLVMPLELVHRNTTSSPIQ
jgi:DNA-binding LacI/PurR family transcriptional regulator